MRPRRKKPAMPVRALPARRRTGRPPARMLGADSRERDVRRQHPSPTALFLAVAALIVGAALLVAHRLGAGLLPTLLIGLNLATFVLYGYDKAVAGRGRVRVPERVLHGLALVGGSPAALFSQRFFRHKTSKPEFQKVFVATLVLQLAAVVGVILVAR